MMPPSGIVATTTIVRAIVCAIVVSGAVASCAPTSGETTTPPAVPGSGGSTAMPAGASGAGGAGGPGGTGGVSAPATDTGANVADANPATTGEPDAGPASDDSASGGDTTSAPSDAGSGGSKIPPGTVAKIMVLGSSNETRTCWRAFLWKKLRAAGVMNFDLVGRTNIGPDCGVAMYDKDVEAAPGTIITGFSANDFAIRYKANPPDIVLVHVGGADARANIPIPKILAAYSLAVEQARLVNPHVVFFVGLHTPQQPMTGILELNGAIPGWAAQISKPDSAVSSVDLFKGIVPAMDQSDGTHLNEAGSEKVSDWFLAPLLPLFKP